MKQLTDEDIAQAVEEVSEAISEQCQKGYNESLKDPENLRYIRIWDEDTERYLYWPK